jgi:hypothetical protein
VTYDDKNDDRPRPFWNSHIQALTALLCKVHNDDDDDLHIKSTDFEDLMPCNIVDHLLNIRRTWCLHLHGRRVSRVWKYWYWYVERDTSPPDSDAGSYTYRWNVIRFLIYHGNRNRHIGEVVERLAAESVT